MLVMDCSQRKEGGIAKIAQSKGLKRFQLRAMFLQLDMNDEG